MTFGSCERAETALLYSVDGNNGEKNRSLNLSDNILLSCRVNILRNLILGNFIVAILSLVYTGLNVALFFFNYTNAHANATGEEAPVNAQTFHSTEFWGTFGFSIVQLFHIDCKECCQKFDVTMQVWCCDNEEDEELSLPFLSMMLKRVERRGGRYDVALL